MALTVRRDELHNLPRGMTFEMVLFPFFHDSLSAGEISSVQGAQSLMGAAAARGAARKLGGRSK